MKSTLIDCAVQLHHETEKAWLVSDSGERDKAVWIPKSQAEFDEADSVMTLPQWLAKDKGLI